MQSLPLLGLASAFGKASVVLHTMQPRYPSWLHKAYTEVRKVDVRLPGKENSNSHGARAVHLIITMIKWIRTSRVSRKNSLFQRQCVVHTHIYIATIVSAKSVKHVRR